VKHRGRGAAGDHRTDFDVIFVAQHFILSDEIVAANDQMGFDDELKLAQQVLDPLGALDLHGTGWVIQLDMHAAMISPDLHGRQERMHRPFRAAESLAIS